MAILHQLSQTHRGRRRGPRHVITGVHVDCLGDYMRTLRAAGDNNIEVPIWITPKWAGRLRMREKHRRLDFTPDMFAFGSYQGWVRRTRTRDA